MEKTCITVGRVLLGIYFLLPGISKIPAYAGTAEYMLLHNIPRTSGVFDAGAEFDKETGGGSWNTHSHTEPRVVAEDIVCFEELSSLYAV